MDNYTPPDIPHAFAASLNEGWAWAVMSIVAAIIVTIIVSRYYYSKSKLDSEQSRERLEKCIKERIQAKETHEESVSNDCKKISEDAKQLQNASSNYDRGLSKATLGDLAGAEAEFNVAIDLQLPVLSKIYLQRGNIRHLQNKFEDAYMDYSKATGIDPKLVEAWVAKGITLNYHLDRHDEAISAYDRAIEIDPKLAEVWNYKGVALEHLGRHDEAISAYDKAFEIDPKLAEVWRNKGDTLRELGKYDEAIGAYDKAIEANPKFAEAWRNKGNALKRLGRITEANAALAKATELDNNGPS